MSLPEFRPSPCSKFCADCPRARQEYYGPAIRWSRGTNADAEDSSLSVESADTEQWAEAGEREIPPSD